jgi:uncharacterized membrane protein
VGDDALLMGMVMFLPQSTEEMKLTEPQKNLQKAGHLEIKINYTPCFVSGESYESSGCVLLSPFPVIFLLSG